MWYLRVLWSRDFADEPVELLSEIGDDGYERRKVHRFRTDRLDWADEEHETEDTGLGQVPITSLDEINAQEEFRAFRIDAAEFELAWRRATKA